jgi:hypothetical protein
MRSRTLPLILLAALGGSACTPSAGHAAIAYGRAVDTRGEPIAGAEIVLNNAVWHNRNLVLRTDADGNYRYELPATDSWYVRGSVQRDYQGRTYTLSLHPLCPGSFAGTAGVHCDLEWRLTGPTPTDFGAPGHYGGSLLLNNYTGNPIAAEDMEITLTPDGALIDGSAGRTLTVRPRASSEGELAEDIPIGRYRVAGKRISTGEPLYFRPLRTQGAYEADLVADFEPSYPGATSYRISLAVSAEAGE